MLLMAVTLLSTKRYLTVTQLVRMEELYMPSLHAPLSYTIATLSTIEQMRTVDVYTPLHTVTSQYIRASSLIQ